MPLILPANTLDSSYDIDNSLRFNASDNSILTYTPSGTSSDANKRKYTFSFWIKRSKISSEQGIINWGKQTGSDDFQLFFEADDTLRIYDYGNDFGGSASYNWHKITNRRFRDPSAWYHIFLAVDTTDGTAGDRVQLYINGVKETSFGTSVDASENYAGYVGSADACDIGHSENNSGKALGGYLSEFHYIDGTAKAHTDFGEFNDNGVWIPKEYDGGSYSTNGFYLEFKNVNPILGDAVGRHKISASNGATFNTSVKKFGGSSLYLDNTNNYLDIIGVNRGDFGFGACNSNNFTIEFWCYKLANSSSGSDFIVYGDNNSFVVNYRPADPQFKVTVGGTEYSFGNNSPALSNTTWTHIAIVNEGGTLKIYKDGTVDGTTHDISGKTVSSPNNLYIGYTDADTFDGYIDELRISNTARYTGNFSVATSQFDVDSNTKLLLHMDADHSIGTDSSGEGNHFVSYNFTLNDQCTDTPTNNFATFNPLTLNNNTGANYSALSEGNTRVDGTSATNNGNAHSTIGFNSGKWYCEAKILDVNGTLYPIVGVVPQDNIEKCSGNFGTIGYASTDTVGYSPNGNKIINDSGSSYGNSFTDNDILGIAIDCDNGAVYFSKGGTFQNSGDPTSGASKTNAAMTFTPSKNYFFGCSPYQSDSIVMMNFGNPAFEIASGNSDANGYGTFEYAPPSGYYAVCTQNLAKHG